MGYIEILIIAGLILINGLFVTAEFALVKVRATQIDQLAEQGNWAAKLTSKALDRLDFYLSASQIGITVASLALGRAIEHWVDPLVKATFRAIGLPSDPDHGLRRIDTDRARGRAVAGHVPAHGAGRAGAQEPGDPCAQGSWRC